VREGNNPAHLAEIDPSAQFVGAAQSRLGRSADIRVGGGDDLPFDAAIDLTAKAWIVVGGV
jgi:hypothetical protein